MNDTFLQVEVSPETFNPEQAVGCFNQLSEYRCDQDIRHQSSNAYAGIRYLDVEGIADEEAQAACVDNDLWVIIDGRIDNLEELCKSHWVPNRVTKTEAASALYTTLGTKFLEQLQGSFSLLIAEPAARNVVLYRSRLGQHPLYYHASSERLIAASEERAIAAHSKIRCTVDDVVLSHLFSLFSSVPAGHTAFANIEELLPGECLVWNSGDTRRWRSPLQLGQSSIRNRSDEEYTDHYLSLVDNMVEGCLPGAGPVGIMLSSGIDSAPAAAIAAQKLRARGQDFTAYAWSLPGFDVADESEQIRQVADYSNIPLKLIPASDRWPLYNHEKLHITTNSPISNAFQGLKDSVLQAAADDGCKVILNGWFGDRLFMFSQHLLIAEAFRDGQAGLALGELLYWAKRKGVKSVLSSMANRLRFRLSSALKGSESKYESDPFNTSKPWLSDFSRQHQLSENWPPEAAQHRHPDHFRSITGPGNFQFGGNTKASFGRFGLEQRSLYQDEELIDFMLSIPLTQMMRLGQTKFIARNTAKGLIPENIRLQTRVGVLSEFYEYGLWKKERAWLQERMFDTQCSWEKYVDRKWLAAQFKKENPPETASLVAWQCLSYELWLEKVRELEQKKSSLY